MNHVTTYQGMVEQPIPTQFADEDVSGGCQAGGAILVIVIVIVAAVFAISQIK